MTTFQSTAKLQCQVPEGQWQISMDFSQGREEGEKFIKSMALGR
jgi:hypothetical protein